MTSTSRVFYVYGVSRPSVDLAHAPTGIDDTPLELQREGELAALVSGLDAARYEATAVERATEDLEWLASRAVAHDQVLTWASDRGPIVPFPMFSLFSSERAVCEMLRDRKKQLDDALRRASEGREYVLRLYRVDKELSEVATEFSPHLRELERAVRDAKPGQGYLLQRKLDAQRKIELRSIGQQIAREVFDTLTPLAVEQGARETDTRRGVKSTAPSDDVARHALVLDAAFLVASDALDRFRAALTPLMERHHQRGFRFEFTGPWPPYHFVQSPAGSEGADRVS